MAIAIAVIALVALNAYVLLAGADFGGGVWDLFATGPRRADQRALIAEAIGPIWEANHVWLILVVVLLFTCFPPAFSGLAIALHIPLTLMLIGIVLRGSAFAFRSYGSSDDAPQRRWGRVFSIASLLTPLLLGVCIGAIASGRIGTMLDHVARGAPGESFASLYLLPWLSPFTIAVGALALALFAFLAGTYLTVEATDDVLREDFRRRALFAAIAVFVTAFLALLLARSRAPRVSAGLIASAWALPLHVLTAVAAIGAILALRFRRWHVARIAAAAQVSLILWGWAAAQAPYLVPPSLTVENAAAPRRTQLIFLVALALGALVLFPSMTYLFRLFKTARVHETVPTGRNDSV
ncbi:MAG TPA: cytochrome d ubiquinol oxidase subunit II [Gemmatimonadaceae bacterium]|nr:cytochrome d ubiquinol oxidase subunit II [Gemmatimonadaceae bacterium]